MNQIPDSIELVLGRFWECVIWNHTAMVPELSRFEPHFKAWNEDRNSNIKIWIIRKLFRFANHYGRKKCIIISKLSFLEHHNFEIIILVKKKSRAFAKNETIAQSSPKPHSQSLALHFGPSPDFQTPLEILRFCRFGVTRGSWFSFFLRTRDFLYNQT